MQCNNMNVNHIKKQFSIFENHPELVYLDNAVSTQTPDMVVDAMHKYYTTYRANIHRGLYGISDRATQAYEEAREKIAQFVGAQTNEIIFTSGTTHGLNMCAYALGRTLKKGDNIVLTEMEHHANIVPWQQMSEQYGFEVRYIPIKEYRLDMEVAHSLIDEGTKVVSFTFASNALGTIQPVKKLVEMAQEVGALTVIDAAQAIAHKPIDVKDLNVDILVASGHKMYGPTGIGFVYAKEKVWKQMNPFMFGGSMIRKVTFEESTFADAPEKFEAGTPHIAGAIGLGAAVDFIQDIGFEAIVNHEQEVTEYLLEQLKEHAEIVGVETIEDRVGVVSFKILDAHPHDVADILAQSNVAVRAGHHCCMPLMSVLDVPGTVRASIGVYNSKEDVDALIEAIKKVKDVFA